MEWIRSLVGRCPRCAIVLGKALLLVGGIVVIAAVFARAGLVNTNADRAAAKLPVLHTLAEAYPQYPTWLVPQGPVGFGVAAVLVLLGMGLVVLGEQAARR